MKRLLTTTALALLTTPALADDFYTSAPVTAATVYPHGAKVTHTAQVDLPAGTHRVFFPLSVDDLDTLPEVTATGGVTLGALTYVAARGIDPEPLFTPAQAAAKARIDALESEIQEVTDQIAANYVNLSALETRMEFLKSISPPNDGATPDELIATAEMIHNQAVELGAEIETHKGAIRPWEEKLSDLKEDLEAAKAAFEALNPPGHDMGLFVVEVVAADTVKVDLHVSTSAWANWQPIYDLRLEADGRLMLDRKADINLSGETPWDEVDVTLSTVTPSGQIGPTDAYPDHARIEEPRPPVAISRSSDAMMEQMIEPTVIMEESAIAGFANFAGETKADSVAVTYHYPRPLSIAAMSGAIITLDTVELSATTEIHANPEHDETAFLMAMITNAGDEPLLPGTAKVYREGHFMGETTLPLIPAGAEDTLPLGPIEGLRLKHVIADNETGDTGILTRSNTRSQQMWFSVQNLTGEAQDLTAFYALPYSEQEDLSIDLSVTPRPDRTDVEDKRNVAAWDMSLAPGETKQVEITAQFDWPEGWELRWRP